MNIFMPLIIVIIQLMTSIINLVRVNRQIELASMNRKNSRLPNQRK